MLEVTPPAEALIVVVPAATAVTNPSGVIVAVPGADDAQVIARFARGSPKASVTAAVSCSVSPATRVETPATIGFSGGERIVTALTGSGVRTAYTLKCDTGAVTVFAE